MQPLTVRRACSFNIVRTLSTCVDPQRGPRDSQNRGSFSGPSAIIGRGFSLYDEIALTEVKGGNVQPNETYCRNAQTGQLQMPALVPRLCYFPFGVGAFLLSFRHDRR